MLKLLLVSERMNLGEHDLEICRAVTGIITLLLLSPHCNIWHVFEKHHLRFKEVFEGIQN